MRGRDGATLRFDEFEPVAEHDVAAPERAGSNFDDVDGRAARQRRHVRPNVGNEAHDDTVRVDEGNVDREAHADRVNRVAARDPDARAADRRPAEQTGEARDESVQARDAGRHDRSVRRIAEHARTH